MSAKLLGQCWDLDLPRPEVFVLMALCDHAWHDGTNCYPGLTLLAYKTGYSEAQVRRILDDLRGMKVISQAPGFKGGRGILPKYEIHLENAKQKPNKPAPKGLQNVTLSKTKRVTSDAEKVIIDGAKGDHRYIDRARGEEPINPNRKRTGEQIPVEDDRYLPLKKLIEAEYLRLRKEPLTTSRKDWVRFAEMLKRTRPEAAIYTVEDLRARWASFLMSNKPFHREAANPLAWWADRFHAFAPPSKLFGEVEEATFNSALTIDRVKFDPATVAIGERILEAVEGSGIVSVQSFGTWFRPIRLFGVDETEERFTFVIPNGFFTDWLFARADVVVKAIVELGLASSKCSVDFTPPLASMIESGDLDLSTHVHNGKCFSENGCTFDPNRRL